MLRPKLKPREKGMMLVILWIAGGLVAVVAAAMLLLPMFVDEQALLDMAQAQVKRPDRRRAGCRG